MEESDGAPEGRRRGKPCRLSATRAMFRDRQRAEAGLRRATGARPTLEPAASDRRGGATRERTGPGSRRPKGHQTPVAAARFLATCSASHDKILEAVRKLRCALRWRALRRQRRSRIGRRQRAALQILAISGRPLVLRDGLVVELHDVAEVVALHELHRDLRVLVEVAGQQVRDGEAPA